MSEFNRYFDLETVRSFILSRGGEITNNELVNYFKPALTNSENKGKVLSTDLLSCSYLFIPVSIS